MSPSSNSTASFLRTPLGAAVQIGGVAACALLPLPPIWLPIAMGAAALAFVWLTGDWNTALIIDRPAGRWRWWIEALAAGLLIGIFLAGVLQPALHRAFGAAASNTAAGDVPALVSALIFAWLLNAMVKGLVYRNFLLSRLEAIFGAHGFSRAMAVVLGAAALGLSVVSQQGTVGLMSAVFAGLGLNAFFYWSQRNFWPAFLAHGVYNTTLIVLAYLGRL